MLPMEYYKQAQILFTRLARKLAQEKLSGQDTKPRQTEEEKDRLNNQDISASSTKERGNNAGGLYGSAPSLPITSPVALYPCVSTPGQRNNVSSEMQMQEDGEL